MLISNWQDQIMSVKTLSLQTKNVRPGTCFQIRQPGVSSRLICELTWSLCSATSSAKPLLGVGITFASVALFGSGSCVYK